MTLKEKQKKAWDRQMFVYRMRGFGMSFTDISKELNVSYGRARDIYQTAERRIKFAQNKELNADQR